MILRISTIIRRTFIFKFCSDDFLVDATSIMNSTKMIILTKISNPTSYIELIKVFW